MNSVISLEKMVRGQFLQKKWLVPIIIGIFGTWH